MECSKWANQTSVTEFLLLGMSNYQDHRLVFIGLLLTLYSLSLMGNSYIVAVTNLDTQLRSPMYFFLSNLSFVDLCLTSVTVPKCISDLLFISFCITFQGCFMQMYLFIWLGCTECFLLTVMSYDRYVAICKPLHYTSIMSRKLCFLLVIASWVLASFQASLYVSLAFHHCFCGPNAVHSFFCELPSVLELSCSDTSITNLVLLFEGSFMGSFLFFSILATYASIITSILKLHTTKSRKKAFLTCSSHLMSIFLFYGSGVAVYFFPPSADTKGNSIMASLMYAVVTPTLNPYIYSLRNNEIKSSLKKALKGTQFHILEAGFTFTFLVSNKFLPNIYLS